MPIKLDNQTILLVFVVVTGLALLLQTFILLAIFLAVRKALASFRQEAENLRSSVMPVIYDTRDLVANTQGILTSLQTFLADAQSFFTRVTPKVESITTDLVQVTQTLRTQTAEMQSSAQEVMAKVRRQSDRVDGMVTDMLNTVDRAGGFVAEAVSRPVRQISGVLRSAKAIVESLRARRA
jgi:type II secretory pathway component PulM